MTPALYLVTLLVANLIQLASPLPKWFWTAVTDAGTLLPTTVNQIARAVETRNLAAIDWGTLGGLGLVLVVPGMVLMLLLWLWVRAVFSRAGTGGILLRVGARRPNEKDLEERQLVNLIEEMAIAGGVRPPQVMLLDVDAVNAAAMGSSIEDSTIVVTRGLLARLDRAETQGVIAHLIGSVGNGDLKILNLILSVFQAFGLLGVLLRAVVSRGARRKLWRAFLSFFRRDRAEVERVADMLAANDSGDEGGAKESGCLTVLLSPIAIAGMAVQVLTSLGAWLFFGPPLTAMWRARRFLADATAVQLTRDPNGITHALQRLTESVVEFDRGKASRILFLHWPSYVGGGGDLAQSGKFHPGLWNRIQRLRAAGGTLLARPDGAVAVPRRRLPLILRPIGWIFWLLFQLLMAAGIVVAVAMGGFIALLALGIMGVALLGIEAFFLNLPAIVHFVKVDLPAIGKALWGLLELLFKAIQKKL